MKKQILFMMFLSMTFVFVSNMNVYGQATSNTAARAITCTTGPLNPIAGVPYTYQADVTPTGGTANWFVTTTPSFISGSSLTTDVETDAGNYVSAATGLGASTVSTNPSQISITWNSDGLSAVDYTTGSESPLFVGIMYEAATDACANNIQVWKIEPIIAFTLDITNVEFDGTDYNSESYGDNVIQCFDEVLSAIYNYSDNAVDMDYGTQTLYFEVIAANFSNEFDASFQVNGLDALQEATVSWGYTPATATTAITPTAGVYGPITAETNETNTSTGVSIYVKVEIANNGFEGLVDQVITLSVDGTDSAGNDDVAQDCTDEAAYADASSQTIEARPTINNPTPTPFAPKQ